MKLRIKQTSKDEFIIQRRVLFFFWSEVEAKELERKEYGGFVSERNNFKYSNGRRTSFGMYYFYKRVLHANKFDKALDKLNKYKKSLVNWSYRGHKIAMAANGLWYNKSYEVYSDHDFPVTIYYDMVADSYTDMMQLIDKYEKERSEYKNKIVYNE